MDKSKIRCAMCFRYYRRQDDRDEADRVTIERHSECVDCRARTLYFAACIRSEDLDESLQYMAI